MGRMKEHNCNEQVATTEINSCPLCNSNNIKFWTIAKDRLHSISDQEFIYKKCISCSVVFLADRPNVQDISKFYPNDYGPYHGSGHLNKPNIELDDYRK